MTDRELMQQALEALEWNLPVIEDYGDHEQLNRQHRAITALRERLAQPEHDAVLAEREACAALVDANAMACHSPIYRSLLQSNADAIRARGEDPMPLFDDWDKDWK